MRREHRRAWWTRQTSNQRTSVSCGQGCYCCCYVLLLLLFLLLLLLLLLPLLSLLMLCTIGPSFGRVGFPVPRNGGLEGVCPPIPRLTLAPEGVISLPRRWTHATHPWQYPFHGIHTHGDQGCWALSQSTAFALGTFQAPRHSLRGVHRGSPKQLLRTIA